jgi:hypothetical protein
MTTALLPPRSFKSTAVGRALQSDFRLSSGLIRVVTYTLEDMGIEDDDIKTNYHPDISSAESIQTGAGETGIDGGIVISLDGHATGDPQSIGRDAGIDGGPTGIHGPRDAGVFDEVHGASEDGGADSGAVSGSQDLGPGETVVEGQQDVGADGQARNEP